MRKANRFLQMKMGGEKIAMLTAYDAPTAGANEYDGAARKTGAAV